MGVLRWPPHTAQQDASLRDICEAYDAWRALHSGPQSADTLPGRDFMQQMMQKFPDPAPARRKDNG